MPLLNPSLIETAKTESMAAMSEDLRFAMNTLAPLELHALAFGKLDENGNVRISNSLTAEALGKYGEKNNHLVGNLVGTFNLTIAGQCPFGEHTFSGPDTNTSADAKAANLTSKCHLGSFRSYYSTTGEIDSAGMQRIMDCADEDDFVSQSRLIKALQDFTAAAPQDKTRTGHGLFDKFPGEQALKRDLELVAITKAWGEAFKLLASAGNADNPRVHVAMLELFITNTPLCFAVKHNLAERGIVNLGVEHLDDQLSEIEAVSSMGMTAG